MLDLINVPIKNDGDELSAQEFNLVVSGTNSAISQLNLNSERITNLESLTGSTGGGSNAQRIDWIEGEAKPEIVADKVIGDLVEGMIHFVQYVTSSEETIAYISPNNIDTIAVMNTPLEYNFDLNYKGLYDNIQDDNGDIILVNYDSYLPYVKKVNMYGIEDIEFSNNILSPCYGFITLQNGYLVSVWEGTGNTLKILNSDYSLSDVNIPIPDYKYYLYMVKLSDSSIFLMFNSGGYNSHICKLTPDGDYDSNFPILDFDVENILNYDIEDILNIAKEDIITGDIYIKIGYLLYKVNSSLILDENFNFSDTSFIDSGFIILNDYIYTLGSYNTGVSKYSKITGELISSITLKDLPIINKGLYGSDNYFYSIYAHNNKIYLSGYIPLDTVTYEGTQAIIIRLNDDLSVDDTFDYINQGFSGYYWAQALNLFFYDTHILAVGNSLVKFEDEEKYEDENDYPSIIGFSYIGQILGYESLNESLLFNISETKVDKVIGKQLSTFDFDRTKLLELNNSDKSTQLLRTYRKINNQFVRWSNSSSYIEPVQSTYNLELQNSRSSNIFIGTQISIYLQQTNKILSFDLILDSPDIYNIQCSFINNSEGLELVSQSILVENVLGDIHVMMLPNTSTYIIKYMVIDTWYYNYIDINELTNSAILRFNKTDKPIIVSNFLLFEIDESENKILFTTEDKLIVGTLDLDNDIVLANSIQLLGTSLNTVNKVAVNKQNPKKIIISKYDDYDGSRYLRLRAYNIDYTNNTITLIAESPMTVDYYTYNISTNQVHSLNINNHFVATHGNNIKLFNITDTELILITSINLSNNQGTISNIKSFNYKDNIIVATLKQGNQGRIIQFEITSELTILMRDIFSINIIGSDNMTPITPIPTLNSMMFNYKPTLDNAVINILLLAYDKPIVRYDEIIGYVNNKTLTFDNANVQLLGSVISGFTGLQVGKKVYLNPSGQIVYNNSNDVIHIGTSISESTIRSISDSSCKQDLGGLKFVKLYESEYQALDLDDEIDDNTMYIRLPDPI